MAMVGKIVIFGEKKDAANRASRCLLDLIEMDGLNTRKCAAIILHS
jgi:hypothetical protein